MLITAVSTVHSLCVMQAFSRLKHSHPAPVVLYPPINLDSFAVRQQQQQSATSNRSSSSSSSSSGELGPLLSINRFERKKNVLLAVEALAVLRDLMKVSVI
jgi:glycosyltransferase involved in cell wall biosynthesis